MAQLRSSCQGAGSHCAVSTRHPHAHNPALPVPRAPLPRTCCQLGPWLEASPAHPAPSPDPVPAGRAPTAKGMFQLQPAAGSRGDAPEAPLGCRPGVKTAPPLRRSASSLQYNRRRGKSKGASSLQHNGRQGRCKGESSVQASEQGAECGLLRSPAPLIGPPTHRLSPGNNCTGDTRLRSGKGQSQYLQAGLGSIHVPDFPSSDVYASAGMLKR